ncbi:PIG-F family protein [Aspergillus puulaauensis]|uniref:Glycosylphosphatidylinositol (GPI) anchor assembly protein n=1 Tax=Aspergillus puulaauensis TaxID=1220207 RepID=A0A7R7XZT6_9EURO|nr:glycosylphosphatidylinositol (GPI) anchor assembly protein [Aspergillus puulaauensis]BCS29953.1 glycosylphosphatidylinositol (GPI) anchor assembly protein [Aspergillus puulaauensis]
MASSAPSQTSATASASTSKPKPSQPPVPILSSQFARVYAVAHPALLLSLVTYRFSSVIDHPISELLSDIPYLVALQVVFVMGCLPPAGSEKESSSSGTDDTKKKVPGSAPRRRGKPSGAGSPWSAGLIQVVWKLTPALLSLTLTTLLATPVLAFLLILFGAPLTTHHALTFLCAAHMALLSCFPLIYAHGVDGSVWREIWGAYRPMDSVWGGALGACFGAWIGAVPIPLDWDRPWQAYPITILTGAYIGYALGVLLGRVPGVFGKKIEFAPGPEDGEQERDIKVD